jgi:hypothetical protein
VIQADCLLHASAKREPKKTRRDSAVYEVCVMGVSNWPLERAPSHVLAAVRYTTAADKPFRDRSEALSRTFAPEDRNRMDRAASYERGDVGTLCSLYLGILLGVLS